MADHSEFITRLRRLLLDPLVAALVYPIYFGFAMLPVGLASALGGLLGRTVGLLMPGLTRRALRNVGRALPELPPERHRAIVRGMWDNLGRTMAEHPHIDRLWDDTRVGRIEMVGGEHLRAQAARGRHPCLIVSGHIANWELFPSTGARHGLAMTLVYRRPNNPLIDHLMTGRRRAGAGRFLPKGQEAARAMVKTLVDGGAIAMLIDQKLNDGLPVPFFGRPAMTAPSLAQLALKYRCPVLVARAERLGGARFRVTITPPEYVPDTGNREADIVAYMTRINARLESWIRERPEQWLWLHNRWPD
ncbi:MAG: lauroyl acyltransferase [Rhodospirillaceae bacterium]